MNQRAIPPYRFVCSACGKTSATRYGFDRDHDDGWDVSCATHAVLCKPLDVGPSDESMPAWWAVEEPINGVHFTPEREARTWPGPVVLKPEEIATAADLVAQTTLPAWDQSDGVTCPICGEDMTLCEHGASPRP